MKFRGSIFCCLFTVFVVLPYSLFPQSKDAIGLYNRGLEAQKQELYQDAIEAYKGSIAVNPQYVKPFIGLAQCYYILEEYDAALEYVSKAKKYDTKNSGIDTLEGMIRTGRGELDAARALFMQVLVREPNNLEARFGLAELDVANGKMKLAAKKYLETLDVSPLNKTALVSLIGIYSDLNDSQTASTYLELAMKYHSDDASVQYASGLYYYKNKDYKRALYHFTTALELKPLYYEARQALGILYYNQGSLTDAIQAIRDTLKSRSSGIKYYSRYLLGVFTAKQGDYIEAIKNFLAALKLNNDDEISRIAAENLAIERLKETDSDRTNLASYHFKNGKLYEDQSSLFRALLEYRRALQIDPHFQDARFAYSRILKRQGYPINYFFNLKILKDYYHTANNMILDEYESSLKKYLSSVSYRWSSKLSDVIGDRTETPESAGGAVPKNTNEPFNQYTIKKNPFLVSTFTNPKNNFLIHLESDKILIRYFNDVMSRYEKIAFAPHAESDDFSNTDIYVNSPSEAARRASEAETDYFFICEFNQLERSIELTVKLYLTRTGSEIATFKAYKTGNNRINDAIDKCSQDIDNSLPTKGNLVMREFDRGILDLGRYQSVKKDDVFLIIRKGKIQLDNSKPALVYAEKDVLGEFKITEPDENISEGVIIKKGLYDFINSGDELILSAKKDDKKTNRQ